MNCYFVAQSKRIGELAILARESKKTTLEDVRLKLGAVIHDTAWNRSKET